MEGAGNGIRSLAVSLETDESDHLSYSTTIDFSTAAHFTALFGRMLLEQQLPPDVDLLKVDVPRMPPDTWEVTRRRQTYFGR
jgi:5'/3'-nucleotidase SurE